MLCVIIPALADPTTTSGDRFIKHLTNQGKPGFSDTTRVGLFPSSCQAMDCDPYASSSLNKDLSFSCEALLAQPVCQGVGEEDRIQCGTHFHNSTNFNALEFLAGCTTGLFDSAKNFFLFMWEVLKWVGRTTLHPTESLAGAASAIGSAGLYLGSEYQKAYSQARSPFRTIQATSLMGAAVAGLLYRGIKDFVSHKSQEFNCLNFQAQTKHLK